MKVQHPQVHQRTDRKGTYWFFRYWHEELLPDGSNKAIRKFHTIGPSQRQGSLTQSEAAARRDHPVDWGPRLPGAGRVGRD